MYEKGTRIARARHLASLAALAVLGVGSGVPAEGQAIPAGFSHIKSLGGIDEYRLDSNGLSVLLVPDHSAPVVTFEVTYQVGSRNEVTGPPAPRTSSST